MKKGLRIGKERIFIEDKFYEYLIYLHKEQTIFTVHPTEDTGKLQDIFKTYNINKEDYRTYQSVTRAVKEAVKEYEESKIEKFAVSTKVILFTLQMDYTKEYIDEDGDRRVEDRRTDYSMPYQNPYPTLGFNYRVVMKVEMKGVNKHSETVRYHDLDDKDYTLHMDSNEQELPWSQDTEDLFKQLFEGLLGLCMKLDRFFGRDNELVIENVQALKDNLIEFKG